MPRPGELPLSIFSEHRSVIENPPIFDTQDDIEGNCSGRIGGAGRHEILRIAKRCIVSVSKMSPRKQEEISSEFWTSG